ncbi:shikimate dehydrogenase [Candidatus Methylospira mobilis]|uniref:Shikimate dehydrogenase (NADP(+)) n=1 Tax=Candidatus Methylospira mobilis TaxID=1808979 RepID=A0A5Q0BNZ3_9GAMM|nr:shikimate dehydrogenase [Candidatus Methylospira mobilis]QFY43818.1 shikimate dehydrogenase [Candidatus Methylospira mobilis]WNV04809.1 shikimate dehydrogenase [Candidatus Methylospira mobilis]
MNTTFGVDRYAVFGHPIGHSKSPRIHTLFAQQTGQTIDYRAQDVMPESFNMDVESFFASGGKGLNCTVPLKELAFNLALQKSERALHAGAVNTLMIDATGHLWGDNTDGAGLICDLTINLQLDLSDKRLLILGAGGASRGIIQPLLEQNLANLVIANRTVEKAHALAKQFSGSGALATCSFDALAGQQFDLIINATSASLSDELPPLSGCPLAADGGCYDLAYGTQPTAFVRWGRENGASFSKDGLGMLVEQAALAFYLWRGVRPDTRPVIGLLESERK